MYMTMLSPRSLADSELGKGMGLNTDLKHGRAAQLCAEPNRRFTSLCFGITPYHSDIDVGKDIG